MAIKKIDSFNKHQNPSTNQNPFDVENYLNVNWDKTQEVVNNNADELKTAQNNISEIKQEQITQNTDIENIKKSNEEKAKEIASLKTELEQTKTNLENYAIHGKSTGEYIHLTDSSETDCRVDVRGNSKQATREGYNELLQNRRTNTTIKGITVVYNEDGTIKASGTATDNTDIPLCGQWDSTVVQFVLKKGTHKLNLWTNVPILYLVKGTSAKSLSNQKDLVLTEDYEVTYAFLRITKGASINATIKPLLYLYEGQDKPYEQYGASPSLDYPSKIETVGSNKNIFDKDNVNNIINALISNRGQIQSSSERRITYLKVKKGTYTITKHKGTNSLIVGYTKTEPKIGDTVENFINVTNKNIATITIEDGYLVAYIFTSTDFSENQIPEDILEGLKIEQGEVSTSYSTYEQGSVKVTSCNKNFFINTAKNVTRGGIDFIVNEDGSAVANGTSTGTFLDLGEILLKPGTYIFSGGPQNGESNKQRLSIYNIDNGSNNLLSALWGKNTYTTTFKEETKVKLKYVVQAGVILKDEIVKPQVEKDTTATEYQVHKEDSVVLPIQEEMLTDDCFDKVNKKEVHTWKKIILDGVNNKATQETTSTNGKYRYKYTDKDLKNCSLSEEKAYCTHLPLIEKSKTYDKILGFTVANNSIYIYTDGDTLSNFNAKLQEENYIFYIPVIESAYEKIDLTPKQIQALEKLNKLKTYKNITNITTDSIAILDVDYKKDLETVLNNLANASLIGGN